MSFFEKARQAADRAAEQARVAADKAAEQARVAAKQAGVQEKLAAAAKGAGEQARIAGQKVRRGLTHERMAELIVKATALQERTNAELRAKNSPYRIMEINITASFPPNIGFTIARLADPELVGAVVESVEMLEQMGEDEVLDVEPPPGVDEGGGETALGDEPAGAEPTASTAG